jgi:hypothetical protein
MPENATERELPVSAIDVVRRMMESPTGTSAETLAGSQRGIDMLKRIVAKPPALSRAARLRGWPMRHGFSGCRVRAVLLSCYVLLARRRIEEAS